MVASFIPQLAKTRPLTLRCSISQVSMKSHKVGSANIKRCTPFEPISWTSGNLAVKHTCCGATSERTSQWRCMNTDVHTSMGMVWYSKTQTWWRNGTRFRWEFYKKNSKELYFIVPKLFSSLKRYIWRYSSKLEWQEKKIKRKHAKNRINAKTEGG